MPTFRISTKLAENIIGKTVGSSGILNTNSLGANPSFATTASAGASINFMSGPIPTQSELDDAYPTWDRFTGSPTEILLESSITASSGAFSSDDEFVNVHLRSVVASATGTATWFIWNGNNNYNPGDRGDAPGAPDGKHLPSIVGSITDFSGSPLGDMILADTNIVAGQTYDLGPFKLEIPRVYTW